MAEPTKTPSAVLTQLRTMNGTQRVRVTRTIVYEGAVNWVGSTVERSLVQPDRPFTPSDGKSIRCSNEVLEIVEELT